MSVDPQTTEEWLKVCLEWRGLEDAQPCEVCGGSGIRCYGSTATWRGSIGGMMFTNDVCNKCWGSGNADRPWPSHKSMQNDPAPRPWSISYRGYGPIIVDAEGDLVARVDWGRDDVDEANARLIVKAVNNAK